MKTSPTKPIVDRRLLKESPLTMDPACRLYEECLFSRGNFANIDLGGVSFRSCMFEDCDLSLVKLKNTGLQAVWFRRCKLLGVQLNECRKILLETGFEQCMLRLAAFNGLDLRNTKFTGCDLREADFSGADLSGSSFEECDLLGAIFFRTNLESADFRSASNYSIPPGENRLRKARFSLPGVTGLLDSFGIEID